MKSQNVLRKTTVPRAKCLCNGGLSSGGEQGIRTLDTGFSPYTRLAGERLRPTRPTLHVNTRLKESGGEGGIRTHDTLLCDGFQDRSVMTASVPLHGLAFNYALDII